VRAAGSRWGGTPKVLGQAHYRASTGSWLPSASSRCEQRPARMRAATPVPGHDRQIGCAGPLLPIRPLAPRRNTTPSPQRQCRRRTGRAITPSAHPPQRRAAKSNKAEEPLPPARSPRAQSRGPFVPTEAEGTVRVERSRDTVPHTPRQQSSRFHAETRRRRETQRCRAAPQALFQNHRAQSRCAAVPRPRPLRVSASSAFSARNPFFLLSSTPAQRLTVPVFATS